LVDKTILALVHSFTANKLPFFQTNDTISKQIGVSQSTVKRSLQKLGELGLLDYIAFNGRTRQIMLTDAVQIEPSARSKRAGSKVKMTKQQGQNDTAGRSERPSISNVSKLPKNNVKHKGQKTQTDIGMPFDNFDGIWNQWREYKSEQHGFKYKGSKSELGALHHLQKISNNDRATAIEIIGVSVANGYKGLFPLRGGTATKVPDFNEFADYIKNGSI
jgi:DNA-binding Lrp family transcriptional regulator